MSPIVTSTTRWNSRVTESSRVGIGICVAEWMNTSGNVDFAGQRVLEIGPASGFLTFEMEKRGADVISVEVTDEHGWDFVPYPHARLEEVFGPRRIVMQQLKNSYWFSHAALQSKAKVYYGDAYNLPAALGEFDIAVMGAGAAPLPRPASHR